MVYKYLSHTSGNRATNATIFPAALPISNTGVVDLQISLEPTSNYQYAGHAPDTPLTFTRGYTADTATHGNIQYATNADSGSPTWVALPSAGAAYSYSANTPINKREVHSIKLPVTAGQNLNFRYTGASTVQFAIANASLNY